MFEKLSNAFSPSAMEEEVRKIITQELSDFYPEITIDNLGNLIIHKPGKKKTIAITAPMDEVNFIVTHLKNDNSVIATSVCNVNVNTLQNKMLRNKNNQKLIIEKIPKNDDTFGKIRNIEISAFDECKANKLNISTPLVYDNNYLDNDKFVIGKALERSVLCSILCDIARSVSNSIYEYYFIFSAQNYCDKKGAYTATFNLKIDELYNMCCVDVENEEIDTDKGPVVILRDKMLISDNDLVSLFDNTTSVQKMVSTNLICEGGYYQKQPTTDKVIGIGLPTKFLGCYNEVISKDDIINLKSVILEKVLP